MTGENIKRGLFLANVIPFLRCVCPIAVPLPPGFEMSHFLRHATLVSILSGTELLPGRDLVALDEIIGPET